MKKLSACIGFVCLFTLLFSGLIFAQSQTGQITGTVLDPTGKPMQDAAVAVRNEASGAVSKGSTDAQGKFSVGNLPVGTYTVEVSSPAFALASHAGIGVTAGGTQDISIALSLGSISDAITVEANTSGSVAAQLAPLDGLIEARSARTEVTPVYIQNFASPVADFSELVQMAPGTFSVNPNGVGLGDSATYFRGFKDGYYDIDFDGVPFYDTNDSSHHSWAFFPSPWIGSVDFDRSPGTASTTGPTPFGGSVHLLSRDMGSTTSIRGNVSYSSFNTLLIDGQFDSGPFGFGGNRKSNFTADVHRMTSDGFETFNYQMRNAGSARYQYKFSENSTLTVYSGVLVLDTNTPKAGPTRGQIAQYGYQFLLSQDFNPAELDSSGKCLSTVTACLYPLNYRFYTYHVPTDVEYVEFKKDFGSGWQLKVQPYTLSYYNKQFYNNSPTSVTATSAIDKLNSYRKYGNNLVVSQVSKWGVLRTGLWYEYAATNRFQIPSSPVTLVDAPEPNFHERFFTNSYQPYVEYEIHATRRLTITPGFKYAYFHQALTQYQDNGKTIGCLDGGAIVIKATGLCPVGSLASVSHSAGYSSYLPSIDVSYRLKSNWSAYGQYSTGTKIPPSTVFDVTGANVAVLPKPTQAKTFQVGSVLKLKQITVNGDWYYIHFDNLFTGPANPDGVIYTASGPSVSKGFEAEVNYHVTRGLSAYVNATAGSAKYSNTGLWVANTPSNTEAIGVTYQDKNYDIGVFEKRIGPMWNDNTLTNGLTGNQIIPISAFDVANVYFNYTIRSGSRFDQTKLKLGINNLFDNRGITGVSGTNPTPTTPGAVFAPSASDQLTLLPGRSFSMSVTFGFNPRPR